MAQGILFVNRYFYPDESATSQILGGLVFRLARQKPGVHVITSRQLIDDAKADLPERSIERNAQIHRIRTSRWGRSSLVGRGIDYLTFYAAAARELSRDTRAGDLVIAKTDPPLIGVMARSIVQRRAARLINWWQDVYPETAEELGVPLIKIAGPMLRALRNRCARYAEVNVVVGRCMRERLLSVGVEPDQVKVIPNWTEDEHIRPLPRAENPLRNAWNLSRAFVVGYSGNMGRGHDFNMLQDAAEELSGEPDIEFLLIGAGARRNEVEKTARERGLDRVHFQPFQPREQLPFSLTVPDVHIVTLRPELEGLLVPSKFYGALAAGRPVVFIGPAGSEVARVIREQDCGFVVDQGRTEELVAIIRRLARDEDYRQALGRNARQAIDQHYSKAHALAAWEKLIERTLE
jgi:glycosyltransferase involved in cell wall biosynthesis